MLIHFFNEFRGYKMRMVDDKGITSSLVVRGAERNNKGEIVGFFGYNDDNHKGYLFEIATERCVLVKTNGEETIHGEITLAALNYINSLYPA